MAKASTNSAIGSGLKACAPPAITSGCRASRSRERSGSPARSSMVSTFVYCSSYWSEKPTTSNSAAGVCDDSEKSGRPRRRISASASGQGAKTSSASVSGRPFSTCWRMWMPRFEKPISNASGKASRKRTPSSPSALRGTCGAPPR